MAKVPLSQVSAYVNRFSVQAPPGTSIITADKLSAMVIKPLVQLVTLLCIL